MRPVKTDQADLNLRWAHMSEGTFSRVVVQFHDLALFLSSDFIFLCLSHVPRVHEY